MHPERAKFLDAKELAAYLHVSIATINKMQAENELPLADYVVAGQRKRLWKLETINQWMEENCKNPRKEQIA